MFFLRKIIMTVSFIAISIPMLGSDDPNNVKKVKINPFTNIGQNFIDSYTGWNSLIHISAIGLTYLLVESNIDANMLKATSSIDQKTSEIIGLPGILLGYTVPIILPTVMYFSGKDSNSDIRTASYAVMQAVGISVAVSSILKAITGRTPPDPDAPNKEELSRDFNFGFLKGGIHYGWPSGHLMTNMAVVSALTSYYNDKTWLKYIGYGYISFLAAAVLIDERGSAHWFSEIIAGGLMGYAIGVTIGKNFRETVHQQKNSNEISFRWTPCIAPDYQGISISIKF